MRLKQLENKKKPVKHQFHKEVKEPLEQDMQDANNQNVQDLHTIQTAKSNPSKMTPNDVIALQHIVGNKAVQRLISNARTVTATSSYNQHFKGTIQRRMLNNGHNTRDGFKETTYRLMNQVISANGNSNRVEVLYSGERIPHVPRNLQIEFHYDLAGATHNGATTPHVQITLKNYKVVPNKSRLEGTEFVPPTYGYDNRFGTDAYEITEPELLELLPALLQKNSAFILPRIRKIISDFFEEQARVLQNRQQNRQAGNNNNAETEWDMNTLFQND